LGRQGIWKKPRLFLDEPVHKRTVLEANTCSALDEILSCRLRRPASMDKLAPDDVPWFMWKTGTSSGRRDAWAVGHNRKVAIGVWAGRFSGLGDVELVGAKAAELLLARLFDLPALRVVEAPPRATPWTVTQPLPPPPERSETPTITSPRTGSTFIAMSGQAIVRPHLSHPADTWFLNGLRIDGDAAQRLVLSPGRYELRSVDAAGMASAISFILR
jgi:membrane carboxypeptidase/penicillin-binding protein PbpC